MEVGGSSASEAGMAAAEVDHEGLATVDSNCKLLTNHQRQHQYHNIIISYNYHAKQYDVTRNFIQWTFLKNKLFHKETEHINFTISFKFLYAFKTGAVILYSASYAIFCMNLTHGRHVL